MKVELDPQLARAILQYLATRPIQEAVVIFGGLQAAVERFEASEAAAKVMIDKIDKAQGNGAMPKKVVEPWQRGDPIERQPDG